MIREAIESFASWSGLGYGWTMVLVIILSPVLIPLAILVFAFLMLLALKKHEESDNPANHAREDFENKRTMIRWSQEEERRKEVQTR